MANNEILSDWVVIQNFPPTMSRARCKACKQSIIAKNEYALNLLNQYRQGYCDPCRQTAVKQAVMR